MGRSWADYASGSGTTLLAFTYTVADPNISTLGIAVLANTLEAERRNHSRRRHRQTVAADLSHKNLAPDSEAQGGLAAVTGTKGVKRMDQDGVWLAGGSRWLRDIGCCFRRE